MTLENLKNRIDLNLDEINKLLDAEKDVKIYKKLSYFRFKKIGFSKIESCKLAGFSETSRYYLEDLWAKGGYNALIPHYGGGRKPKLSKKQLEDLKIKLHEKDSWLVGDVKKLIEEEYEVKYTYQNVKNLLLQFNVPISNHFEIERENKKNLKKTIENYGNFSDKTIKEINELKTLMKPEKSTFVYRKLNYLLFRAIGFSNKDSSELLNVTSETGNNWYNAWNNEGYNGLLRKKGQGRKTKISKKDLNILKKN